MIFLSDVWCLTDIKIKAFRSLASKDMSIINRVSLKFMFGFLGILVFAMVSLVITSYLNENSDIEVALETNLVE